MPRYAVLGATGSVGQSLLHDTLQSPTSEIHAYCCSSQKLENLSPSISSNKQVEFLKALIRTPHSWLAVFRDRRRLPSRSRSQKQARLLHCSELRSCRCTGPVSCLNTELGYKITKARRPFVRIPRPCSHVWHTAIRSQNSLSRQLIYLRRSTGCREVSPLQRNRIASHCIIRQARCLVT